MNNARSFLDRRAEPRVSINTRGRIMHGDKLGIWADCLIKDLSESGAKIELSHLHKIPPRFILINFQGSVAFEVVLKWRRGDLAGMAFEVRHDLEKPVPPRLEPVQAAWKALR
jgi:hypothetical protein